MKFFPNPFMLGVTALFLFSLFAETKTSNVKKQKKAPIFIVTADKFEKIIKSHLPVVLDVYADWCPPCRKMKPIFDDASRDFIKEWRFAKISIDSFSDSDPTIAFLKSNYGITIKCIPTFIIFVKNKVINVIEGSMNLPDFKEKITSVLKESKK